MRLFRCSHRIFITSLRWPRGTVGMQGIELGAIFSLLSSLFSLFSAPSSLLSSALESRNRILAFSQGNMRPRSRPPRRNAAIRHVLGANKPCSELSCAIDGAPHCLVLRRHSDPHPDEFFLIEMLPHLISANLVAVQLLLACFRCCCLICTSCLL